MTTKTAKLIDDLRRDLDGSALLTDADLREGYASDDSEVPAVVPEVVIRARSTGDVQTALGTCHLHDVPTTPRGAGTSRVGGAVPSAGGVVLCMEKMATIRDIDPVEMIAIVEPGVVTGALHAAVEAEGLFYPPDPNSLESCTLGGNIGSNAGGPRAYKYGSTRDYVLGLEVVTHDGGLLRLGKRTRKGVTGYDLTALMVGSEGTLGVVTEATLKLLPRPEKVATLLVLLPEETTMARAVVAAEAVGVLPRCVEFLDGTTLDLMRGDAGMAIDAGARAMLIVELDGREADVASQLELVGNAMTDAGALEVLVATRSADRARMWSARREMSHTLRRQSRRKLSEDVVVPRGELGALLETCRILAERAKIAMPSYGHAGDGNLHVNFLWDDDAQWPAVKGAIRALFEEVVARGGTLTGEHGLGVLKAPYLSIEQSAEVISLQRSVKRLFDPKSLLNPGKIFARTHGIC